MDEATTERVLRAVEQVPAGSLVSYGDIAAIVGTGARHVGSIMRHWGSNVAWWRVTNRNGDLPVHLLAEARGLWRSEGIGIKADGRGARIGDHRADLARLADAYDRAVGDLCQVGEPVVHQSHAQTERRATIGR